ncbi:DUF4129 domain-containing protein [Halobacillus fulvus]|nr:DUF4129 domain-containing protein [Halobacillus fulvus]
MIEGKKTITMIYKYISEALLLFFFLYPISQWFSLSFSFYSFALLMAAAFTLFFLASKRLPDIFFFLMALPLSALGWFLGIHWVLCIGSLVILMWRYHVLEEDPIQDNEFSLLIWTSLLAFVELAVYKHPVLALALLLQFASLLGGYSLSHYLRMEKKERQKGTKSMVWLPFAIGGVLALSLSFLPFIRTMLGTVWNLISYLGLQVAYGVVGVLNGLGLNADNWLEGMENQDGQTLDIERQLVPPEEEQGEISESIAGQVAETVEWGVIFIIVAVAGIVLFFLYRLRKNQQVEAVEGRGLVYETSSLNKRGMDSGGLLRFQRTKAAGPIRKHFDQFESFARKHGAGRYPQESLDEWFSRLGLEVEHTLFYQKVRYGGQPLNDEEVERFYDEIKQLKKEIKKRDNERRS